MRHQTKHRLMWLVAGFVALCFIVILVGSSGCPSLA